MPGINESHYIPKAKHVWDPSFAPGDLFLESHDSHWAASTLGGLLSTFASLPVIAWIGRLLSWSLFAWAWIRLSQALRIPSILSPFALGSWYFAVQYGHWAGEWVIGGFEAKTIAYPAVLLGLAALFEDRWKAVWLWMAIAVAWHPVVGGWAGLSCGIYWLCLPNIGQRLKAQWAWLALGTVIGLIGVIPALSGLGAVENDGNVVASQVHTYYRLAHHMCPQAFASERHVAAVISCLTLLAMTLVFWQVNRKKPGPETDTSQNQAPRRLLIVAWISVAIAFVGAMIDLGLTRYDPALASKLLRFYWFRWADAAVPLAWTGVFWHLAGPGILGNDSRKLGIAGPRMGLPTQAAKLAVSTGILATVLCVGQAVYSHWRDAIPPADRLMMDSPGPLKIESDRFVDWLAVCDWIQKNTPEDSLWLTPKHQQTFKWYAHRAEVVCWKDVPQDNASVLEWFRRIGRCEPPRDARGIIRGWTDQELIDLSREFEFEWVLLDRTIQRIPPRLEIVYPIDVDNRSFAIFRIRPSIRDSQ